MTGTKQNQTRREEVVRAASEVFARYGYQKASMQDIASAAGVSKSVLFKYFGTKEKLYQTVFRIATEGISDADMRSREMGDESMSVFEAMRRTVEFRAKLFARFPWVYSFAYTAAFDGDPFVQELVRAAYQARGVGERTAPAYRGIRADIPNEAVRRLIFWVSQGFLEEKRKAGDTKQETVQREFEEWIDLLERILGEGGH